tara:strand:+ start:796 stop:1482 length:687 start_codon:yes stop_codon:yes gene_type:complete
MANYEKHDIDENKFQCPKCEYAHGQGEGKSRQGVSIHFKKSHLQDIENIDETPLLEADKPDIVTDEPEWLNFTMSEDAEEVETVSISPLASTLLRGMVSEEEMPKSAKAMKEYYKQQGKMMRWIFSGFVDPIFGWWGKSITADPTFEVKRASSDWELFEDASTNWLEYHGMSIPLTPDLVMLGTIGTFYAPVISSIHQKRDPSRISLFKKWRIRRAMKKSLKTREVEA